MSLTDPSKAPAQLLVRWRKLSEQNSLTYNVIKSACRNPIPDTGPSKKASLITDIHRHMFSIVRYRFLKLTGPYQRYFDHSICLDALKAPRSLMSVTQDHS